MKNYELKISQFIDNELSAKEQQELFSFLSGNEEARQTLSDYMEMKKETKSFYAGMNPELDDPKIIAAGVYAQKREEKKYKMMFYFSAAASIILFFLLLFQQFRPDPMFTKYQNLQAEMIKLQEDFSEALSKQIELVKQNNQLYEEAEKLKTVQVTINQPVQKKPVAGVKKKNIPPPRPIVRKQNNYLASIPVIKITKDDFIGQQIIGN